MEGAASQAQALELFINNLPDYVKGYSPLLSKMILIGSFGVGFPSMMFCILNYDCFTPFHTNSINVFMSMVSHLTIVIGPSAFFAHRFLNYSLIPSSLKPSLPASAGQSTSLWTRYVSLALLSPSVLFIGLTLCDSLSVFFALPLIVGQSIAILQSFSMSKNLQSPIWQARQLYFVSLITIITSLMIGYRLLAWNTEVNDSLHVLRNI